MKYHLGQKVKVGGKLGAEMIITKIEGDNMILESKNAVFYYTKGDCTLIPVKDYEQLTLF